MMLRTDFLRTRVGGRILTLFFVGAIVPVVVLAALSFRAVSDQLAGQSETRLLQVADATVRIILERLASAGSSVQSAGELVLGPSGQGSSGAESSLQPLTRLVPTIEGIAVEIAGEVTEVAGSIGHPPPLSEAEDARIRAGVSDISQIASRFVKNSIPIPP